MVTEMITLKLEDRFLKEIDSIVKTENYQNRTEFIRAALRDKVETVEMKRFREELTKLKGSAKKKVSEEEYERVREQVFEEFDKKFR